MLAHRLFGLHAQLARSGRSPAAVRGGTSVDGLRKTWWVRGPRTDPFVVAGPRAGPAFALSPGRVSRKGAAGGPRSSSAAARSRTSGRTWRNFPGCRGVPPAAMTTGGFKTMGTTPMTTAVRRFTLLALSLLTLLGLTTAAAQAAPPVLGIADQKADTFLDPRFASLGVKSARINMPWDVLVDPATLENADRWMANAKLLGVKPLLTIDRSRRPGKAGVNPTTSQIAANVRGWRLRWPGQVKEISTWNEGNINKQPALVAKWYLAVRKACPGCIVLGADIVDRSNAVSWAQRFIKAAKRTPAGWGLHNYVDVNRFSTKGTVAFLKNVPGEVWLTETGGVVSRSAGAVRFAGQGPTHAAKATKFLFDKVTTLSPRIRRVYVYHWGIGPGPHTWDSALIAPDGSERPALAAIRAWQKRPKSAKKGALAYKAPKGAKGPKGKAKGKARS